METLLASVKNLSISYFVLVLYYGSSHRSSPCGSGHDVALKVYFELI